MEIGEPYAGKAPPPLPNAARERLFGRPEDPSAYARPLRDGAGQKFAR